MRNSKTVKIVRITLLVVFFISIIPILAMAFYAKPLFDDYNSTVIFRKYYENRNYLMAILSPIIWTIGMYISWQGTYTAEFLFALQPGAWPIPAYWLTTFIIIGSVSVSVDFFFRTIADKMFNSDKNYGSIIALLILTIQFQKVPFIHQGFYWYNGAIYYSFFFALALIEVALMLRLLFSKNEINRKRSVLMAVLAFVISGGNYSTALVNCLFLFLLMFYVYVTDKGKFRALRLICIVAFIGLVISMIAPGNAVRAASDGVSMPALRAIYKSVEYALWSIKWWLRPWQIAIFMCMVPVINKMVARSKVKFRFPVVALALMFGLYVAQMTPPFYGLSSPGAERQIDMYYYSFYLLITGCLIYMEGWIIQKLPEHCAWIEKVVFFLPAIGALVLVVGVAVKGVGDFNSYKIWDDIASGRAEQYDREYKAIAGKMAAEDGTCYVQDISQWTYSLDKLDIQKDPEYWTNKSLAEYYGCEQVILSK
ncbi:MAG: hypothetical protein E7307_02380 [Butyrivibrio sp.]|nr:hypothetical protein [Butyrivibrio sp.]